MEKKIELPFITLVREYSFLTERNIIECAPISYFDAGPGDRILHKRFIEKYKPNENANIKTS